MNNYLKFSKNCQDTYSSELELKREIISTSEVSLLDLSLTIKKKQLKTKLFDKRDKFPFSIVFRSYSRSNISTNIYYATIGSQAY